MISAGLIYRLRYILSISLITVAVSFPSISSAITLKNVPDRQKSTENSADNKNKNDVKTSNNNQDNKNKTVTNVENNPANINSSQKDKKVLNPAVKPVTANSNPENSNKQQTDPDHYSGQDNETCDCCSKCKNSDTSKLSKSLLVEKIEIIGCNLKNKNLILKTITIKIQDFISPDDSRLLSSKLRLLALGLFEDIEFSFKKGSKKGRVILVISLKIRGTLIIKHIFIGSSRIIPFWLGLSGEEKNFLNRGITLGGSVVGATPAEIMGGRPQAGFETYVFFPSLFSIPILASGHFNYGSEFYRIYGNSNDGNPDNFLSIPYKKSGLNLETFFPFSSFYVRASLKEEHIYTTIPSETIRHFEDGTTKQITFGLQDKHSIMGTASLKLIHDTRDAPFLPSKGHFISAGVTLGNPIMGSSYTFTKAELLYDQYFKIGEHILSTHLLIGGIAGNPPLFEKFYIGDIQDLVAPRALGMNMSVAPSPNFLGTNINETRWGTAVFKLNFRYDYPFLGRHGFIYRGNIFVSTGIFGLFTASQAKYRETDLLKSIPIDLTFDFGIHLDTKYGTFKLSISNAIGRLPF